MPLEGWIHRTIDELSRSPGGAISFVRHDMGISAFGVQLFELRPGVSSPEHSESRSGQEELYVGLGGNGKAVLDGEPVPFGEGVLLSVASSVRRQMVAEDETLRYLCVGGVPGGPYVATGRFR